MEETTGETPRKKLKPSICIICCCDAHFTEKDELFTNLLVKQFLSSSQNVKAVGELQNLEFCINCTKILDDLLQLQTSLEFILKNLEQKNLEDFQQLPISLNFILTNIKQKKTEIKIKILKSQYTIKDKDAETFRRISTRDFCPTVQISKEDCVDVLSCSHPNGIKVNNARIPEYESKELQNSLIKNEIVSSPITAEQTATSVHKVKNNSLQFPSLQLESIKSHGKYNDDKIRSEEISIQPKHQLPFLEQETVAKFEPWHDFRVDDEESNGCDEFIAGVYDEKIIHDLDDPFGNGQKLVAPSSTDKASVNEQKEKIWKKPELSNIQLCLLSIMSSDNMQMTHGEISDFITDNFPFYKSSNTDHNKGMRIGITSALRNSSFIIRLNERSREVKGVYGILNCRKYVENKKLLADKLNKDLSRSMAFPERLPSFKFVIKRNISDIRQDNLDSERTNEETTNFGETFTCVETDYNTVKIEHCIYAIENDDSNQQTTLAMEKPPRNRRKSSQKARKFSTNDDENVSTPTYFLTKDKSSPQCLTSFKVWPAPTLCVKDLCILAVFNSSNFYVTMTDAQCFITENFPFYALKVQPLQKLIKNVLTRYPFTELKHQEDIADDKISSEDFHLYCLQTVYTVTALFLSKKLRMRKVKDIVEILRSKENLTAMAYPERISLFIEKLHTNKCTISDKKILPKTKKSPVCVWWKTQQRKELQDSFKNLKDLVPYIRGNTKCSKNKILEQAKEYIKQLESFENVLVESKLTAEIKNQSLLRKYARLDVNQTR